MIERTKDKRHFLYSQGSYVLSGSEDTIRLYIRLYLGHPIEGKDMHKLWGMELEGWEVIVFGMAGSERWGAYDWFISPAEWAKDRLQWERYNDEQHMQTYR